MADAWRLDGRVVMVGGAAGGIGSEVVRVLLGSGACVSVCDLVDAAPDRADVISMSGDLSSPGACARWLDATLERWGRVDGLVNVTGRWESAPFTTIDGGALDAMLSANFNTAWHPCRAIAPLMLERGSGSIVNFASTAGEYGSIRPAAHYAAAKGAIIAFTKSLARELSPSGIRVNAVSPGPTSTSAFREDSAFDETEATTRTLFGRMGRPVEIAHAVQYLLSDASTFVTGSVLAVNGGSLL